MPVNDGDRTLAKNIISSLYTKGLPRGPEEYDYALLEATQLIAEEREKHQSELIEQHEAMAAWIDKTTDKLVDIHSDIESMMYGMQKNDFNLLADNQHGLHSDIKKAADRYHTRQKEEK